MSNADICTYFSISYFECEINLSQWLWTVIAVYSLLSIARTRIDRIPDRSNTLADSMFRFVAILNSYYCCGGYFYKPESPEVRILFALRAIQTCKNGPHDFELSKFNCILLRDEKQFVQF